MANVQLGSKAVGSIVKLKVNGTAKEFIVVHQGKPSSIYDESCNGTWLLMKDIYENRLWNSSDVNKLESSTIHAYLNSTFLNLFDSSTKDAIKQVKIPYRANGGSDGRNQSGANGLLCKIFLLSGYEVGLTESNNINFPVDGAKLDYFDSGDGTSALKKRIANLNGMASYWWLRSPQASNTKYVWFIYSDGTYYNARASIHYGIRPALVLPPDMEVDSSGNVTPPPPATHKTIVNGTAYEVKGGKCLVNGTSYDIKKGRTLIGGTGYDITFAPPFLKKGDLITMNLDGTSRLYRVLSVNWNVCKVLGMWDDFTSKYNGTITTTNFNGITAQKYEGSDLDTYLNTTWYNTLSSEAKNAIVPENVVQYCYKYYDRPNTPNTPKYTYQYQYNWSNSSYDNADNVGNVIVGNRNVFALDLKDIFDYIGKVCITSDELMTMFWNSTTKVSKYPWLRSSNAGGSNYAWRVNGNYGFLGGLDASISNVVRPALNIDMSKIQYTIV